MARSDTRYSIYPAPKAVEVVGNTSPALNQAIECWAALLARATAENQRRFEQAEPELFHLTGRLWQMNEWLLLADALKGLRFDPEFANPGLLLATAVEDAHRLEYIGAECLEWGGCDSTVIKDKDIDFAVKKVVEKLRELDYVHAWALVVAIQWFLEHRDEGIAVKTDSWWTLKFRHRWQQKHSRNKLGATTTDQQKAGKRRSRKSPPLSEV